MKKALFFVIGILILNVAIANHISNPTPNAKEIFLTIRNIKISLFEFSYIERRDFELISGKKMNLLDKLVFKKMQNRLRSVIKNDGTFRKKIYNKAFAGDDPQKGFHAGGFFLGFLLGLLGLLIAILLKDEKRNNRMTWAFVGFGASIVVAVILYAAGVRFN